MKSTFNSHVLAQSYSHARYASDLTTDVRPCLNISGDLHTPTHSNHRHTACSGKKHTSGATLVSPDNKVGGQTQAQLADDWWQWVNSLPNDSSDSTVHPVYDDQGVGTIHGEPITQNGLVYNLVGSYNSQAIEEGGFRSEQVRGDFHHNRIFIKDDQYIFAPVLNVAFDNGAPGVPGAWTLARLSPETRFTETELRRLSDSIMKTANNLFLEVDKVSLISNMDVWQQYRQTSPAGGFSYTPPEHNILSPPESYPAGVTVHHTISDGYWFMLNPLSVGQHTIHFGGVFDTFQLDVDIDGNPNCKSSIETKLDQFYGSGVPGARFELDITYKVTVVPANLDLTALAT